MQPHDESDIAGLRAVAEGLEGSFREMLEKGPQIQAEARRIQVTEVSDDGLISVTVGVRGDLIRLDIDPRIYRRPDTRALADSITETIHAASARAQEQMIEAFAPIIPREQIELHMNGTVEEITDDMTDRMLRRD